MISETQKESQISKMVTNTEVVAPASNGVDGGCCKSGPGYASPPAAMSGPSEKLIYVTAVYTGTLLFYIFFNLLEKSRSNVFKSIFRQNLYF